MEPLLGSALLAAVSGLTYIAYKHPRAFKANVAYPLLGITIFGVVFINMFVLGAYRVTINSLVEEVSKHDPSKPMLEHYAEALTETYNWQRGAWAIGIVVVAYLLLLISLPKLLSLEKQVDKGSSGPGE